MAREVGMLIRKLTIILSHDARAIGQQGSIGLVEGSENSGRSSRAPRNFEIVVDEGINS